MSLVKGYLEVRSNPHTDGMSKQSVVKFVFNPTKLDIAAGGNWEQPPAAGHKKAADPQFKGTNPATIDLVLILDGWEERNKSRKSRKHSHVSSPSRSSRSSRLSPHLCGQSQNGTVDQKSFSSRSM